MKRVLGGSVGLVMIAGGLAAQAPDPRPERNGGAESGFSSAPGPRVAQRDEPSDDAGAAGAELAVLSGRVASAIRAGDTLRISLQGASGVERAVLLRSGAVFRGREGIPLSEISAGDSLTVYLVEPIALDETVIDADNVARVEID